ncbi:hypothetical protein L3Q82_026867, partial [Scortum barcoo]
MQRCYISVSLSSTQRKELCIFSDASTVAIGAVAYLRAVDTQGQYHVGFVMGKSMKLAPRPAHTIPRLELCAAVLAVELYELISEEIDTVVDAVKFFTDSLDCQRAPMMHRAPLPLPLSLLPLPSASFTHIMVHFPSSTSTYLTMVDYIISIQVMYWLCKSTCLILKHLIWQNSLFWWFIIFPK